MATRILPILPSPDDLFPQFDAEKHAYTNGGCGPFAVALHRITGWPIVVFDIVGEDFAHLGVRAPDGALWDGSGPHQSIADFVRPFTSSPPETLRNVTLAALYDRFPGLEHVNLGTERHASMMFPDLPHLPTSDRSRVVAFMDDVEVASRWQNAWIVADRSAMHRWPVIGDEFEEIVGYRLANNHGMVTFDRALRSEAAVGPSHASYRIHCFIKELTAISRRHRLWIRSGGVTLWPRIEHLRSESQRIAHYVIRQSDNAGGFLTNLSY